MRLFKSIAVIFLTFLLASCGSGNEFTKKLCQIEEKVGPTFIDYDEMWLYTISAYSTRNSVNISVDTCQNVNSCVEIWFEKIWKKQIQTANEWKRKVEDKESAEVLEEIADVPLGSNFQEKRSNLLVIEQKYLELSNLCKE